MASWPRARRWLGSGRATKDHPNEIIGLYFGGLGIFYGIALGLIAVAAWENWSAVEERVKEEGALVRALRSDSRSFPHPLNERLPAYLHEYVEFEKDSAWKYHALGIRPPVDSAVKRFRECLFNFSPRTMGEQNLQAEVMRRWNDVLRLRSMRTFAAESDGLSVVVWFVVLAGAALNIIITWMFVITPRRGHVALTSTVAAMIGLLVFLLLVMNQPFRGVLAVSNDPFVLADRAAHSDEVIDHSMDAPAERCAVPKVHQSGTP